MNDPGEPEPIREKTIGEFDWKDVHPAETAERLERLLQPLEGVRSICELPTKPGEHICIAEDVPPPLPFNLRTAALVRFWRMDHGGTPEPFNLRQDKHPTQWAYIPLERRLPEQELPRDVRRYLHGLAAQILDHSKEVLAQLPGNHRFRIERCLLASLRFAVHFHTMGTKAEHKLLAAGTGLIGLWVAGTPFIGVNHVGTPLIGLLGPNPS